MQAHDTCKYVYATFMREIAFDYILVKKNDYGVTAGRNKLDRVYIILR